MKEIYLEIKREMIDSPQKPPSLKMITSIIKHYEDLIILYMMGNYRVQTRSGVWQMIKRTNTSLYGKDIPPVTTISPRLYFSKEITKMVGENKNLLMRLKEDGEMQVLPEEKFNEIKWKLRNPLRDLT